MKRGSQAEVRHEAVEVATLTIEQAGEIARELHEDSGLVIGAYQLVPGPDGWTLGVSDADGSFDSDEWTFWLTEFDDQERLYETINFAVGNI